MWLNILTIHLERNNTMTKEMRLEDFNYNLPQELIAQDPLPDRASSRLLVLDIRRRNDKYSTIKE